MLAIKRQSKAFKAISAGALAFTLGLTGVAAYVGSTFEHQNLVFSKEQTASKENESSGQVVLGASQDATVTTSEGGATDMPWVVSSGSQSTSSVPTASVSSNASATGNVTVSPPATPTAPDVDPPVVTPSDPTPDPAPVLPLCVDVNLLGLPIQVGVNCRES